MVTKLGTAYVRFFGHNEKIVAGLTEADTNIHYLDLSSWIPENTVLVILGAIRTSGVGEMRAYPNEGPTDVTISDAIYQAKPLAIKNRRVKYRFTAANDVYDIYLFGYFVEYPISRLKKEG